jgi:hypothetical protein
MRWIKERFVDLWRLLFTSLNEEKGCIVEHDQENRWNIAPYEAVICFSIASQYLQKSIAQMRGGRSDSRRYLSSTPWQSDTSWDLFVRARSPSLILWEEEESRLVQFHVKAKRYSWKPCHGWKPLSHNSKFAIILNADRSNGKFPERPISERLPPSYSLAVDSFDGKISEKHRLRPSRNEPRLNPDNRWNVGRWPGM